MKTIGILVPLAFLLCFALAPSTCQTVQLMPYDTLCNNVGYRVGDPIYVIPGYSIDLLVRITEQTLYPESFLLSSVPSSISFPFVETSFVFVCNTYMPKAYIPAYENGTYAPVYPCKDTCDWFVEGVRPFLELTFGNIDYAGLGLYYDNLPSNTIPINCTGWQTVNPYNHTYFSSYNYSGYEIPCLGIQEYNASEFTNPRCTDPFVKLEGISCGYKAPSLPITHSQYDAIMHVSFSIGLFNVLMCILFFAFLPFYNSWWRFPGYLIPLACIQSFIGSFSFMGTMMVGVDEMWGNGGEIFRFINNPVPTSLTDVGTNIFYVDTSSFSTSSPLCTLQAFGIYLSVMEILAITLLSMFSILIMLNDGKISSAIDFVMSRGCMDGSRMEHVLRKINFRHFINLFMIVPVISVVYLCSDSKMMFSPGSGYCGIDPRDLDTLVPFWVVPLITISLASLIIFVINISIFLYIVVSLRMHKDGRGSKIVFIIARIMFISFFAFILSTITSITQIYISTISDQANRDSSDFINCSLATFGKTCTLSDEVYVAQMTSVVSLLLFMSIFPLTGVIVVITNVRQVVKGFRRFPRGIWNSGKTNSISNGGKPMSITQSIDTMEMEEADNNLERENDSTSTETEESDSEANTSKEMQDM